MSPKLTSLLRRVESQAAVGLRAGAQAVSDEARRNAGPLAPGVLVGRIEHSGRIVACETESRPVDGAPPPVVREFGSGRSRPHPYMRPAANRGPALVGAEVVKSLRSIR